MEHAQLTKTLDASVEAHAFSGVISIRRQDALLYERTAGYADRSNKIENTLATRFGIASGTKFFTALAIGKLIEAQKLSFSTKLKDCIALNFPRYSQEITIRHLLTHTSGIPDYFDEEKVDDFDNFFLSLPWYALKGPRDYLELFPDEAMKFAPGERFSYSNGGYILLGVVIEELTGLKYQDFVEQAIFKSIGMSQSGFFALNKLPEKTAFGYIEEAEGWRTNVYNLPIIGASDGGAFTTVQDIDTLWKAFWSYEILPKALVEIYTESYTKAATEREHTYYGHGLWIREDESRNREAYITGCDAGVSFKSIVNRDTALQVTVISNTTDGAWPVLRDIDSALTAEGLRR
ncbi:MAG TPA: serine hydrolase domain-containing protein [Roseiflexaceae bacterium]|nr:serine hydrolase domain-containing protein [Roseiflexaceae bacterium]